MGILLETDYKKVLQGKESIVGAIGRMFGSSKAGTQNPLERRQGDVVEPQQGGGQMTYEAMNRDSGTIYSLSLSAHSSPTFLSPRFRDGRQLTCPSGYSGPGSV